MLKFIIHVSGTNCHLCLRSGHRSSSPTRRYIYIGNPDSALSSDICYGLSSAGTEMRNFYFFFDARKHFHAIREKIVSNAHVPLPRLRIEDIVWLEMERAQTIVVANKRFNDALYFSRIPVDELLHFFDRLEFPAPLVRILAE